MWTPKVQRINFGWNVSMQPCIYMHTNTQKHGCRSADLLCYRADVTAHLHHHWSRPVPQKTGRAPPSRPHGLVRNRQVTETGRKSRLYLTTDLQALSCEPRSAAARPRGSRSSARLRSRDSPGLNQAAPCLAGDRRDPLWRWDEEEITCIRNWTTKKAHMRNWKVLRAQSYFSCLMDLIRSIRFFSASVSESRGSFSGTTLRSVLTFSCICTRQRITPSPKLKTSTVDYNKHTYLTLTQTWNWTKRC